MVTKKKYNKMTSTSTPIPKPRTQRIDIGKRPVPLPRQKIHPDPMDSSPTKANFFNTLKGEISEKVVERKNAVMESARNAHQVVKNSVVRRFNSLHRDGSITPEIIEDKTQSLPPTSEVFQGISFESPFSTINSREPPSFPPPKYPPPPVPDDSVYDEPHSTIGTSSSSGSASVSLSYYEEIFPEGLQHGSSDSDQSDQTTTNRSSLNRSESWSFYDSVSRNENIYNNIQEEEEEEIKEEIKPVPPQRKQQTPKPEELSKMNILRLSEISSISVQNTLYENHILEPEKVQQRRSSTETNCSRVTESMIYEFDPLKHKKLENEITSLTTEQDLSFLEQILQGDTYGTFPATIEEWCSDDESDIPVPPAPPRSDSLPNDIDQVPSAKWFVPSPNAVEVSELPSTTPPEKSNWMKQRLSGVFQKFVHNDGKTNLSRGLSFRSGKEMESVKVGKPPAMLGQSIVTHQGLMLKIGRCGGVEDLFSDINPRWCYLGNGKLTCYNDNTLKVVKETILVDSIMSVQLIQQNRVISAPNKHPLVSEDEEFHCFEITTSTKGARSRIVFGVRNMSDRRIWMQKLIESQTAIFPTSYVSDYLRAGWVFLREGASGPWKGTWLLLHNRELVYIQEGSDKKTVDLRKARCIILQEAEPDCPKMDDNGPQMLVDCAGGGALYVRTGLSRNTVAWRQAIRSAAHNNGAALDQQQITNDNVPVVVDKCINFLYAHGSMSEGIYRRSGTGKVVTDILTEFSHDAWAVQLTKDRCNEHDVACVLKRFMRNLPEPALTTKLYPYFCKVSEMESEEEKVGMYKKLLGQFPPITHQTIKKLMAHLHFIQTQSGKNQMTVKNLATVWGPTLMHAESNENQQWSKNEINVIVDLISLKNSLWPLTPDEILKEKTMLAVLERYYLSSQTSAAARVSSGDLKVWIYLNSPSSGVCYHVTLTPQKTALDICRELSSKIKLPAHEIQLEESVLSAQLTRPLHYSEKVLNAVLQWSYWDNADCKDNCLVLKPNELYKELAGEMQRPVAMSGELKYADDKSKAFKNFMFEFSQAKLSYYKDKSCSVKISEWKIEDIVWYIGNESKRNPHTRWCITFFQKSKPPKRAKSTPWFGHAIAGSERTQQLRWLYSMILGEYPQGFSAPPIHVDLIEA